MAEDGDDDEDVLAELTRSVVIGESLPISPLGYSISEGRLAYNEEWDETAMISDLLTLISMYLEENSVFRPMVSLLS